MTGMQFAQPQWVHLIWLVVLLTAVLGWLQWQGGDRLDLFLSKVMQQRLVRRPARWRRIGHVACLGLSGVGLVLALMRPQWGLHEVHTPRVGAEIMVCLDVSRSMLATDTAPNRLERAKAEIQDMLSLLDRDHVGLIAFAGKATVLCPLTPDFGFLRMILQTAGPQSVARGGTNLEAPIRKALAGFRGPSDLSRVIMLITDGEDHNSFAMDAAADAAQRGIRIIAIGLGDEAGSQLFVIDPATGARTQVTDSHGKPVVTRLDGQLLRQMALKTEGVYIPAGTGSLDLRSIYDAHIAPLTRGRLDDRRRLVKQESFQWMVLLALVSLVAAAVMIGGRPPGLPTGVIASTRAATAAAALLLAAIAVGPVQAQQQVDPSSERSQARALDVAGDDHTDVDPRQAYNDAVTQLNKGMLDEAEDGFMLARRWAGADGLTRYRATYNLSWVEVSRADAVIKKEPKKALTHLNAAAAYLRDAIRLQPNETIPRRNLEVVSRRVLAIGDALAKKDKAAVDGQIDQIIDQQRQLLALMGVTLERVAQLEGTGIPEPVRGELRRLEVEERRILASVEAVVDDVRQESDQLEAVREDDRSIQQRLRLAQMAAVGSYLHGAVQRIGQARLQLRQHQADRAYRRASLGLNELKRARDQLRDFVQLLGAVIDDASGLAQQTGGFAASDPQAVVTDGDRPLVPPWLTREYLEDSLMAVHGRTDELLARFEAAIPDNDTSGQPGQAGHHQAGDDGKLVAVLQRATPLVQTASGAMTQARDALVSKRDIDSYRFQVQATVSLMKAQELFLDIRGLVERMYTDQRRHQATLTKVLEKDGLALGEALPLISQLQAANVERGDRLRGLIEAELESAKSREPPDANPPGASPATQPQATEPQQENLVLARDLLSQVMTTFDEITSLLATLGQATETLLLSDDGVGLLKTKVDRSVAQIESLRRLFLTIVEHLRQTAQKQVQLVDETRDVAALSDPTQIDAKIGPLLGRQRQLAIVSQQIADALDRQSESNPAATVTGSNQDQEQAAASQEMAHRLVQAADRVNEATQAMDDAVGQLESEPVDTQKVQDHQAIAVEKLAAALELLSPSQPPQEDPHDPSQQSQDQSQNEQGNQRQEGQGKAQDEKDQDQKDSQQMNASRLLQAVRDRQAQRQRDRAGQQPSGYAPVEKDW